MIILCQGDFQEQIKKLVTVLLCTMRSVEEKTKNGYCWYPVSNPRVNDAVSTSGVTELLECKEFVLGIAKNHLP
jgi:hypothetical protein